LPRFLFLWLLIQCIGSIVLDPEHQSKYHRCFYEQILPSTGQMVLTPPKTTPVVDGKHTLISAQSVSGVVCSGFGVLSESGTCICQDGYVGLLCSLRYFLHLSREEPDNT
jgi:hypothetical protein